jgi:citrate synthase
MVKTFNHGIFEDKAFTDNMINELSKIAEKNNIINPEFYKRYDVKRDLEMRMVQECWLVSQK